MADIPIQRTEVRIPNLPMGKIVDDNGMPTQDEQTFRQALLTLLESIAGNEGLVSPSLTNSQLTIVQNNTQTVQGATPNFYYTCQFGTIAYQPSTVAVTTPPASQPPPNDILWAAYNQGDQNTPQAVKFRPLVALQDYTIAGSSGSSAGYVTVNFNGTLYKLQIFATS